EDVPAKDGESVKYRNFYIDKNRNGKIDSDEEKVSFSGSTGGESNEEGTGCPVYGLYGTSSTTPIRITVKGTKHSVIYGVYKGQLETEKETAVTIDLQTDNLSMACGAFNSKVSSVDMQVNGNVSTCFGAMGDSTVDKVQVHINSGKQEQIYGTENSSVGSVDITVARSNDDTSGTIYGVQGGTVNVADTSETAIHIAVSKGSVGVVKAMCGADVTTGKGINKAVAVEISGGNIMGSLDGISGGTVVMEETTGTALAIDVKGNTAVNGSLTGIQNTMGGSSDRVKVKGSVDINIDGQQGKSTTGICTAVNGAVDLDGGITVNVDHADMTCGLVMAQNGAVVEDDVLLDMGADASVTSGPGLKGIENAVAKKNVTLNVRGSSAASSSDDLYGAYGSVNGYNYTVGGDLTINYMGGTWGTLYGAYMNAHVQGNLTMRVKKGMIQGLKGTYQSNIGMDARILAGKYALESSDSMTEESAVVKIAGYQGVYGFAGRVGGDCEFRICNSEKEKSAAELDVFNGTCDIIGSLSVEVTGGKYSSCNRNAATHVIGKACNIVIQDVQLSGGYDSYALNGTRVNGECNITWKQVESNAAVYMISEGSFAGDVAVTASDSQSTDFYGLSGVGEIHGNYVMHCEGNGIADGTYSYYGNCYAVYSGRTSAPVIRGNVEIVMKDCRYNQFNGVSGVSVPEGTITIKLQGGNYATGLTPATVNSSNACKKLEFTAEGTSFGTEGSNWTINNTIYGAGEVTETIADTCTLSGTYTVTNYCSSSYDKNAGSLRLMVGGNLYYAGYCRPEENVTAKNIYTCDGTLLHIPAGVTVQVEQNGFFYGTGGTDCLVEGTLKGAVDTRNGSWCKFFIHEGNLDSDTSGLKNVFYPISVKYNKTAGSLTWSGTSSLRLCEGILFGNTGSTVTVTGTAKKGYELQGAYAKKESDKDYSNMAAGTTDNSYKYTMTAEPVAIRMDFAGTQISLGKSAPDPIAKLNEVTTAEEPLYDMADVIISNDGEEGELTYALVEEQSNMPEGLQFADGKIYGTPTVLNETGSKVVIRVTGRNGSTADLSLVIKVTETGEGTGSQEGRIRVDAEKQEVHLQGNSVVIAANGEETAVYIDDDLDGVADFEEPAYSGDLSAYTVYGIKGATIRRPLQLTMTGGTVKSITVVENADVSVKTETDAVKMQMTGGKVSGGITMAEDAEITGTMALCISGDATYKVTNMTYGNNVICDGWYQDIKGDVTIDGIYKLSKNIEIESIRINKNAKCTLSEGSKLAVNGLLYVRQLAYFYNNGEVETGKTIIDNGGYVYNKGTYTCTGTFDNYGRFLVIGGTLLPEDNAFNQVYYPVDIQCDLKNTSLKKDNNTMGYYTVGDSVMLFGWAGADCSVSATDVPGYVPYISVNDNKLVEMGNNSYTFRMPRKATTLHLSYQPIQISAQKAFADPTAVIAREYTTDDPLYDLNNLVISNDTTSTYGQDMVYELQPGSELPAGVSLSEGKLIGTVAVDAKDSDVTFIVTGRNGTTTEVQMHIAVSSEMTQRDINKLVKISGYTIDLQGTSVVIRQAAGDATKTSIYLDDDRDGIADNTNALQMNQSTELALSSYSICGCTKASESKVDGDISIYMYGGTVNGLYGVYGESNKIVRLNSDVAVYVKGGSIKSNTTAAQYAYAKNVTLDVQGGDLNRRVYAAYEPQNVDQVCFRFGDKAGFYNTNSGDEYGMAVTYKGTVKDIIATVGSDGNGRF
ncbi:MAG: hypothetical protein EGQ63_08110, partial [Clostridiales bacterium]|nr:hypothetical protein [Clostridiales bacterium]